MPHRDFLASILPYKLSLRSLDRRRTLETDTILYRDSLSPLGQAYLCRKSVKEITENGYISTVATQGITKPYTDLRKFVLNMTYGLPMNQNRRIIARSILII
ncbi:hypothetical protein N7527_005472 [Penicillium freii]|nr:hypothetical protein N7527_005472 [Penicillium freii]